MFVKAMRVALVVVLGDAAVGVGVGAHFFLSHVLTSRVRVPATTDLIPQN